MLDSFIRINIPDLERLWEVNYVREYQDAWLLEFFFNKSYFLPFIFEGKLIYLKRI